MTEEAFKPLFVDHPDAPDWRIAINRIETNTVKFSADVLFQVGGQWEVYDGTLLFDDLFDALAYANERIVNIGQKSFALTALNNLISH
jgi:hypothetical protein